MTSGLQNKSAANEGSPALSEFRGLSTDEQLGVLWVLYEHMGESITPAAPGAAGEQFIERLLEEVKGMDNDAQLTFMRNLVEKKATDQTKVYGGFTEDNKLAFWYKLAVEMSAGTVVPVPDSYELSAAGSKVFNDLAALNFNAQITVLRDCVLDMGA